LRSPINQLQWLSTLAVVFVGAGFNVGSNVANLMKPTGLAFALFEPWEDESERQAQDKKLPGLLINRASHLGWQIHTGAAWRASGSHDFPVVEHGESYGIRWQTSASDAALRWHYRQLETPAWPFAVILPVILLWWRFFFVLLPKLLWTMFRVIF